MRREPHPPLRALFVNTGILGHRSVAHVIDAAMRAQREIDPVRMDLSARLSTAERVVRRLLTLGPRPASPAGALTAARFRHELNAGLTAGRRIGALERRGERFDAIHFHTQAAAWASLGRMRRTPSIVSIDITQRLAMLEAPRGLARRDYLPNAAWDRRVFRAAAAIVATSRWAADDLTVSFPNVRPGARDALSRAAGGVRRGLARTTGVFAGRTGARPLRGRRLRAQGRGGAAGGVARGRFGDSARLTLVTESPLDEAALPAGVEVRRGVRAYTAAWFDLWRQADVFALPTRGEAFGMVFQEAAAAGLPGIGTALNAIPEIVRDGETGILVPPGDVSALAAALRALVSSPEERSAMGRAARGHIETAGSVARYGERLAWLIRSVAGGRDG